jgi:bifunctional UDP-N-acetylglucosamine pyrophosphorylase/glucosamine-1-phosphate N-acetyltransferase
MQSAIPTLSAAHVADVRFTPAYYFQSGEVGPYVQGLLRGCRSVFGIKAAMAADLDRGAERLSNGHGVVEEGALLQGEVVVQAGARIEAGAQVIGPVLICTGAVISAGALVRDHSVIGPGCRIGFGAEITRSLLAGHVFMKHPCFIGDSVIGRRVNIGSFCSTTGLRCDRGPIAEPAIEEITVNLDGQRITTGQTKFGAIIGDKVALPAGTVLSPGTLIGPGTVIYPRDHIGGFLPAGSRVR